jgi:hypothetical protein
MPRFFRLLSLTCLLSLPLLCGCLLEKLPSLGAEKPRDQNRLSLLEIGEQAMETGERLEEKGLTKGALEAYERAVWALSYHERLTGTPPLMLDDAKDSVERMQEKISGKN